MYICIQINGEHVIKDILYKRYSNVSELLDTFIDFNDLYDFLIYILNELKEEQIYDFYIHKSIMSEISFDEFRNKVLSSNDAKKLTDDDVREIVDDAASFLPEILGGDF